MSDTRHLWEVEARPPAEVYFRVRAGLRRLEERLRPVSMHGHRLKKRLRRFSARQRGFGGYRLDAPGWTAE